MTTEFEVIHSELVMRHYVDVNGLYLGGWNQDPPDGAIEVPPPEVFDQVWQFPGWGASPSKLRHIEDEWRDVELVVIAAQLDALEEAEHGDVPEDLQAGNLSQWLKYRGLVRNWVEGKGGYPEVTKRPKRPF